MAVSDLRWHLRRTRRGGPGPKREPRGKRNFSKKIKRLMRKPKRGPRRKRGRSRKPRSGPPPGRPTQQRGHLTSSERLRSSTEQRGHRTCPNARGRPGSNCNGHSVNNRTTNRLFYVYNSSKSREELLAGGSSWGAAGGARGACGLADTALLFLL